MATRPQHILITGASSGIGAALALHYAAPGIALALNGRDRERLAATADACRARGALVESAAIDVTDRAGIKDWIERIAAARPVDLVIANAGVSSGRGALGEDEAAIRRVLATNVEGVLNTVLPLLPHMLARRHGQIALMSSLAAFRGLPTSPAYSASKAALKALGEAWRLKLAPDGIHVSVICPGFVTTRMTARNTFRMPFLMSAEAAAAIIARGLSRDQGCIAFPWPAATLAWLAGALPWRVSDALLRRTVPRR